MGGGLVVIGVRCGGPGGCSPPPAFENFCKFGQIRASLRFKIFFGKFGLSLGYFWSVVLDFLGNYSIFFGQERSAPPPARKWPGTSMTSPKGIVCREIIGGHKRGTKGQCRQCQVWGSN